MGLGSSSSVGAGAGAGVVAVVVVVGEAAFALDEDAATLPSRGHVEPAAVEAVVTGVDSVAVSVDADGGGSSNADGDAALLLPFLFAFNDDRLQRFRDPIWDGVGCRGLKHRDVENRVYLLHRLW